MLVAMERITDAADRIATQVVRTPVLDHLGDRGTLGLKAESLQPVGSFKARGALNAILVATRRSGTVPIHGVVAHSSGNHAQAVAWAAARCGLPATVVMPSDAPALKIDRTRGWGAEVVLVGPDSAERAEEAARLALQRNLVEIPPFDHDDVIAGAGTVGLEIAAQAPEVDLVLVPVSGGGLISGVAVAIRDRCPGARIVGVEPEWAADAQQSLRSGRLCEISAEDASRTSADGLRVRRLGTRPWEHIKALVDDIVTVSEAAIGDAVVRLATEARLVAEPSGAVAAAAWWAGGIRASRPVAIVSGGNVDRSTLAGLLSADRSR